MKGCKGHRKTNDTDTLKQITHNTQKANVNASWKEVSSNKRNQSSPVISRPRKQPK